MCIEKKMKHLNKDELKEFTDLTEKVEACQKKWEENHPGQHDEECKKCWPMVKRLQDLANLGGKRLLESANDPQNEA